MMLKPLSKTSDLDAGNMMQNPAFTAPYTRLTTVLAVQMASRLLGLRRCLSQAPARLQPSALRSTSGRSRATAAALLVPLQHHLLLENRAGFTRYGMMGTT